LKVIEVKGIGKPKHIRKIYGLTITAPWVLIEKKPLLCASPKGTIAFDAVEVLE